MLIPPDTHVENALTKCRFPVSYLSSRCFKPVNVAPCDRSADGPEGNPIYFPYIGRQDLYGWVHYLAKAFLLIPLVMILLDVLVTLAYDFQQRRLDREMPPSKIAAESSKWLEEAQIADPIDACVGSPDSVWQTETDNDSEYKQSHYSLMIQLKHSPSRVSKSSQQASSLETFSREDGILQIPSPSPFDMVNPTFKSQEVPRSDTDLTLTDPETQRVSRSSLLLHPQPEPSRRTNTGLSRSSPLSHFWSSKLRSGRKVEWPRHNSQRSSYGFHDGYNPTFTEMLHADRFLSGVCPLEKIPRHHWLAFCSYILAPFNLLPLLLFHRTRPQLLFATLSYANNLDSSCQLSYPTIIRQALAHPSYSTLDWRSVALMGRLKLTHNPPAPPSRAQRLVQGWLLFCTCAVLVIGTELTIQWNYITDINNINSVGQLVPFTVGVGGLIKVCWSAVFDKEGKKTRLGNRCIVVEKIAPWIEAMESWKTVKKKYEMRVRKEDPLDSVGERVGLYDLRVW